MALGQYLSRVPNGSGLGDYWDDVEGVLAFLLGPTSPDSSRGSCSFLWYARGPSGIGNKSSDYASWTPPPSRSEERRVGKEC